MITTIEGYKRMLESIAGNHVFPAVFYHGSNQLFDTFSKEKLGQNFEQSTLGIYFSQFAKPLPYGTTAREYAEEMVRRYGGTPYVYECKLNLKNPLVLDTSDHERGSANYIDSHRELIARKLSGHDSIVAYNFSEDELKYQDQIAVVFDPADITILSVKNASEYKGIDI